MPPKKRKAADIAATANGTPARKKKMTKNEKQEAWDRAQAWAKQQKDASPSVASVAAQAVGRKKSSSPKKKAAAASTKKERLEEARARAAKWAATELSSPPGKKKGNTIGKAPPMASTPQDKKKRGRPRKKSPQPLPKQEEVSTEEVSLEKEPEKSTPVTTPETATAAKEADSSSNEEKKSVSRAKIAVAVVILLVSFCLAVCSLCQHLPLSVEDGCVVACDKLKATLHLVSKGGGPEAVVSSDSATQEVDDSATNTADSTQEEKASDGSAQADDVKVPVAQETDGDTERNTDAVESTPEDDDEDPPTDTDWQKCRIFTAPSKLPGGGWGVFAAQDFAKHEMVEVSPLYVPIEHGVPVVKNTVLDDYIYGYIREEPHMNMATVSLGNIMIYNHDVSPNVVWMGFGEEPNRRFPDGSKAVGMVALRDIKAGEELFSSYGLEDGGETWFKSRRMERQDLSTEDAQLFPHELAYMTKHRCPRVFAGFGRESFESQILEVSPPEGRPKKATHSLHPHVDAGFGKVIAKVPMKPGEILDTAPGLTMRKDVVAGTALAPLVLSWSVLGAANRITLRELRETGKLIVQHQSPDTEWKRLDQWDGYDNMVILTLGSIAMMKRVGHKSEEANCRLEITGSGSDMGSAGLILRVVATRDIEVGELIRLGINGEGSEDEHMLLQTELQKTGQPQ